MELYLYPHRYPHQVKEASLYLNELLKIKEFNDCHGFEGILLFTSHEDPYDNWSLANQVFLNSNQIPIVATSPYYEHPYSLARRIQTLQIMYKRDIAINWITGLNLSEQRKLGLNLCKDAKYALLGNYVKTVNDLLKGKSVSCDFHRFSMKSVRLSEKTKFEVRNFVAGSSKNINKFLETNAFVKHIGIALEHNSDYPESVQGLALGIIARETQDEALKVLEKFMSDYEAPEKYIEMSKLNSDSEWKSSLFDRMDQFEGQGYFASVLRAYSQVPFFVGSYKMVAEYLRANVEKRRDVFFISMISSQECNHVKKAINLM